MSEEKKREKKNDPKPKQIKQKTKKTKTQVMQRQSPTQYSILASDAVAAGTDTTVLHLTS